jgi:hypothetical protein
MKDDSCGEIPVAFVVASGGSGITEDEIKQYVAKQVRYYDKLSILAQGYSQNLIFGESTCPEI